MPKCRKNSVHLITGKIGILFFKSDAVQIKIDSVANTAQINYTGKTAELKFTGVTDSSFSFLTIAPGENDISNQVIAVALPNQANIRVEWRAVNKLQWYPWEKFYGIFIDKLTGSSYETGLQGFKRIPGIALSPYLAPLFITIFSMQRFA